MPIGERFQPDRVALSALTIVLLLFPIFTTPFLPLVDLPKHLGRAFILGKYGSSSLFADYFARSFDPIPNIAIDLLVSPMIGYLGPSWAGRLFVTGIALTFAAGALLLGRSLTGRYSALSMPSVLFFYSSPLFYGFVNYVAGVAVFMLALGHWLRDRDSVKPGFLALSSMATLAAYFTHLTSYAALAVAMLWFSLLGLVRHQQKPPQAAIRLLPLVLPAIAFLLFMQGDGSVGVIEWNSLRGKAIGLLPFLIGYDYPLDGTLAILLVLGVLYVCRRHGHPRISWDGAALGVIFLLLFAASPKTLLTASGADLRWVVPGLMLLVLSLDATPPKPMQYTPVNVAHSLAWVLLAFQTARISSMTTAWHSLSRATEAQLGTFMPRIAEGATLYSLSVADSKPQETKWQRSLRNNPHYATVLRGAVVSNPFAIRGQQPLYVRSDHALAAFGGSPAEQVAAASGEYDYIWLTGRSDPAVSREFAVRCEEVVTSPGAVLCRVRVKAGGMVPISPPGQTQ